MAVARYTVTRLPGAALRRAGRAWALGDTEVQDLSGDELAALALDPGYRVIAHATDGPTTSASEPAPAPARARRPRKG